MEKINFNLYLASASKPFARKPKFPSKRTIFGFLGCLAILGMVLQPLAVIQAAGPRFNIFTPYTCSLQYNQDYYLICVKNETKGTTYGTSQSADPGDILTFSVYYHNGVNYTIANNTKLRVSIPSGQSTYHTVTAYLWADNAENATAGSPLTFSNTVNVSSAQTLEYVAGSAKWYPDQSSPLYDPATPFLYGQTGNEIVGSGVNVGNIEGCWEFSGMVNFKVKVSQVILTPDLTIAKTVRNITKGETSWSESTNAQEGEKIGFSLKVNSTGNTAAQNVTVSDNLPYQLSYVGGSTKIDGVVASDGIVSGGISLGTMNSGTSKTVTFEATVNANQTASVTNYGKVWANQVSEKQDTATICLVEVIKIRNLTIAKTVRNITEGQTVFQDSIQVKPRQTLEFQIIVTSGGNTAVANVIVRDQLPANLLYVSGSTTVEGISTADGITTGGINIGSLSPGQSKTIKFRVNVEREVKFVRGQTTLTNYGYTSGDLVSEKSDTAQVIVVYSGCDPENNMPGQR